MIRVIYDKLLVEPLEDKSFGSIIIPDAAFDKASIGRGKVISAGEGYPIANTEADSRSWEDKQQGIVKKGYLPLSVRAGDVILYFRKHAVEIVHDKQTYFVITESAVVVIECSINDEINKLIGEV